MMKTGNARRRGMGEGGALARGTRDTGQSGPEADTGGLAPSLPSPTPAAPRAASGVPPSPARGPPPRPA